MAIQLVGSNLNAWGDNGRFESDTSTWLGASPLYHPSWMPGPGLVPILERSSSYAAAGSYSAIFAGPGFPDGDTELICNAKPSVAFNSTKKYLVRVKVRTNNADPVAPDTMKIIWKKNEFSVGTVFDFESSVFISEIKDDFVELELRFSNSSGQPVIAIKFDKNGNSYFDPFDPLHPPPYNLWIDEFKIFEYIDTDDIPDPEPEFDTVFHSKNPIVFQHAATGGWESIDNYRYFADIQVEDENASGVYNSKLKLKLYPDVDGNILFYMRQAFPGIFEFVPPGLNEGIIKRLTDRIKRWRYLYGEMQEDEVEPSSLATSLPMLVLYGGIAKSEYPTLDYFSTYLPASKKFLTWAPTKKMVDRFQEDYLNYWVFSATTVELQMQVKAYYDDGSDETEVTKTLSGVLQGQLYQLPAGPVNSGAAAVNVAKNLVRYELCLLDQDDVVISEVRTYIVAQVRHPLTRVILFLNSLGAYETIRFVGQAEAQAAVDREIVSRFQPHNYDASGAELEVNRSVIQETTSLSTGFLKDNFAAEWFDYLKDLMISPRIYDITNGNRRRIVFNDSSMPGRKDQDYMFFARFQALGAFRDDSYTPNISQV